MGGVAYAQAWRDCTPNSIGPGGCDSIGPGGGRSIGPEGGLSIGPGGGLSIGPYGGQSIGPGGGQSIGPGGGKALDRDRTRGLDTDTMRPYNEPHGATPLPAPQARRPIIADRAWIDRRGHIFDRTGLHFGVASRAGDVTTPQGDPLGRIDSNGNLFDLSGGYRGTVVYRP